MAKAIAASTATPPTTPPAMAPTGVPPLLSAVGVVGVAVGERLVESEYVVVVIVGLSRLLDATLSAVHVSERSISHCQHAY